MLKGHTKIELTNVKTGQKQVIEDDNLITNAMSKMLEQMPFLTFNMSAPNPFTNPSPLIDRLCGGILLFSDPIDEDPDNYLTPSGNKMVGNARVNYASAQDVPEFGAYNGEESTWNPETGERKYVYDFSTSKGNGTISCVCLTNPFVGYYGLGNTSGKKEALKVENVDFTTYKTTPSNYFWGNKVYSNFPTSSISEVKPYGNAMALFGDYNENCIYAMDYYALTYNSSYPNSHISNGSLKLYKYYCPFSSFDPMRITCNEKTWELIETIDLEVPSEIASLNKNYTLYSQICYDDAIYIVFSNNGKYPYGINVNADFKVWKISYDLTTSEVITMKNNTGVVLHCGQRSSGDYNQNNYIASMVVHDGYLICSSNYKVFKIKLTDSTDVTEFANPLTVNPNYTSPYYAFYKLGNTVFGCGTYGQYDNFALNLKTNTVSLVNGVPTIRGYSDGGNQYYPSIPIVGSKNFAISAPFGYLFSNQSYIVYNCFMLSTINNLAEPVVKTSDLAMKITYTLSLDTSDEQEVGDS